MPRYAPEKITYIEPFGTIDIAGYEPLLDSRPVQKLKHRSQLGLAKEVFLNATHTRLAHSVAVMGVTHQVLEKMYTRGFFEDEDQEQLRRDLSVAALLHDVGHPPFSHTFEFVLENLGTGKNHNLRGKDIIHNELAGLIRECGSDPERVISLLDKNIGNPRGRIITSKSLGADKMAYLWHDQRETGYNASMPGTYKRLLPYLCFVRDKLCVEEKPIKLLEGIQKFYFEMYTQVYLRKQMLAFGRISQKSIEAHVRETGINADDIWDKSEGWVETQLEESESETARTLHKRILHRNPLKAAVSIKLEKYADAERIAGKPISVVPTSTEGMNAFISNYNNPLNLTALESLIAKELGIGNSDIGIAMMPAPAKLIPEDVVLVTNDGSESRSLFERLPNLHALLRDEADEFLSIRIMVDEKQRVRASQAHKALLQIIEEHSGIKLS